MEVFLINLDSATGRLASAQEQLGRCQIAFERISAIRGADLSASEKTALYSEALNKKHFYQPLSDGEIGCSASHLAVWKIAKQRQLDYCLVLEDDFSISESINTTLLSIEQLPNSWDIIRLNSRAQEIPLASKVLHDQTQLIRFSRVPSRTTAYVISKRGIDKLLNQLPPFFRPIDIDFRFFWEFDLNMFGIQPSPVTESALSLNSSIERKQQHGLLRRMKKLSNQVQYSFFNSRNKRTDLL
jgi:glycosyl transferase, family 25